MSADALIDGDYHGAFTYFLCAAAEERRFALTYAELAARTRQLLQVNGYDQVPQLEGPREIGTLNLFAPFAVLATVA